MKVEGLAVLFSVIKQHVVFHSRIIMIEVKIGNLIVNQDYMW